MENEIKIERVDGELFAKAFTGLGAIHLASDYVHRATLRQYNLHTQKICAGCASTLPAYVCIVIYVELYSMYI